MKKYILLCLSLIFILSCDSDGVNYNNKYLPNYNFAIDIDMNLPLYTGLQYPVNPVFINQVGVGINGIIVMNTGGGGYKAFDASCPNQPLTDCSLMTIEGAYAVCPCDDVKYSLFDGSPNVSDDAHPYFMKPYRVTVTSATSIRVSN
jgi:nitrite reductase/ring-hydroxylating ferredoxin subunit